MKNILDPAGISKRLRTIMITFGTTRQKEFAKMVGIDPSSLSTYLNGRPPSSESIARILHIAHKMGERDITADWILFGDKGGKKAKTGAYYDLPAMLRENMEGDKNISLLKEALKDNQNYEMVKLLFKLSNEQKGLIIGVNQNALKNISAVLYQERLLNPSAGVAPSHWHSC